MNRIFSTISKFTSHLTTIIFLFGFLFDAFVLPDIGDDLTRYIGLFHLSAVAFLIIFREWIVSRNRASEFEQKIYSVSTFGISYFSGAALSFVLIYAIRSAALSVSWPLFVIFLLCILANEFVSTHGFRFTLDIGVFLTALLFYTIFTLPLLLKVQNDSIFTLSVFTAIAISFVYVKILKNFSDTAKHESSRLFALSIGIPMFVGMFYVLNIIPAVPLSLEKGGIYHKVIRGDDGKYLAEVEEDGRFLSKYRTSIYNISATSSEIYFFSAISAPAELTAPITHVWERYDEKTFRWVPITTISFGIFGGREEGYRAFSKKENITEGLWRVTVKVDSKRIVGSFRFNVKKGDVTKLKEISL